MPTNRTMPPARISLIEVLRSGPVHAVIFDMDGVLTDTESLHLEAWARLVEHHAGRPISERLVRETFGRTNDAIIPLLWAAARLPPPRQIEALSREKEEIFRARARGRVSPLAGVERLLEALRRRGVPLAIGTSAPPENVRFMARELGWEGIFDVEVDRGRFREGKPAPDCFLKAAQLLRHPPDRTLVFEDSLHGLLAARRGGFLAGAVETTLPRRELWPHARWVFGDFREIAC